MELCSTKPSDGISSLGLLDKGLLFAELASIAYKDLKEVKPLAKKLGFTAVEMYDNDGAQAYRFQNARDCVIVCRGTEPTEFNDIKADLQATPVRSETVSRVHKGFKKEVDDLWPMVVEDVRALKKQTLWFAGHSLGAAMATVMASRCFYDDTLMDPAELHTYGSPRVGWPGYVKTMAVEHHRWVNNNDVVTKVPLWCMGYRHDGIEHYIDSEGDIDQEKGFARFCDGFQGMIRGIFKGSVDLISDHNMSDYIAHIAKAAGKRVDPKV
jgi:triacylglycerol lipase